MELELKHLSAYYPYDLKVQYFDGERGCMSICDIAELRKEECTILDRQNQWDVDFYELRPILRAMSDLKKLEWSLFVDNWDISHVEPTGWGTDMQKDGDTIHWGFSGNYRMFEDLFKNHFDVFGLIEKGLAIDKNILDHE